MIPGQAQQFFEAAAAQAGASGHEIERSLRFNGTDASTPELTRTPGTSGNTKTFTLSFWTKRSTVGGIEMLLQTGNTYGDLFRLYFSSDKFRFHQYDGGVYRYDLITTQLFRDVSAWYHIVVAIDTTNSTASERAKLYVNGVQVTDFDTADYPSQDDTNGWNNNIIQRIGREYTTTYGNYYNYNGYLAEFHNIDGQQLAASDFGEYDSNSVWQPKEYSGTYGTNGFYLKFADNSSNAALGTDSSGNNNTWTVTNFNAKGSDWDQSETWSSGVTGTVESSYPATNMFDGDTGLSYSTGTRAATGTSITWTPSTAITGVNTLKIGTYANIAFTVNGSTVSAPASIGLEVSIDKATYFPDGILSNITWAYNDGSNYVYITYIKVNDILLVDDGVVDPLAKDIDSLIDSPTNYTAGSGNNGGNYATLNPLDLTTSATTFSNANLDITSSGQAKALASFTPSSGKWYAEVTLGSIVTNSFIGLYGTAASSAATCIYGINGYGFYSSGFGSPTNGVSGSGVAGDVIGMALDIDAATLEYYKNGVSLGTVSNITFPESWALGMNCNATLTDAWSWNFGQRPFAYTPPTNYVSWVTTNLSDPTIANGATASVTKTFNANNGNSQSVSTGFSPDLVWTKSRANAYDHQIFDIVRGDNENLNPNLTNAESTVAGSLIFDSSGFTMSSGGNNANYGTGGSVAWTWDAGSSTVSNTDGSLTSSVRANASSGCSIVSVTTVSNNSSIGHGLNASPGMLILKNRDSAGTIWAVWHSSLGTNDYLVLNSSDAKATDATLFNGTTSSTFTVGTGFGSANYICYCFAPVEGYSAFGSYTGNGDADGPFIYTNFRPRWVMVKSSSNSGEHWLILDTERDPHNLSDATIYANLDNAEAEAAALGIDILSNGFKPRGTNAGTNASGYTYIYAAFAEHPFKTARAR